MGYTIEQAKGIEINGKVYPCDPGDEQMLKGIAYHFPEIDKKLREGQALQDEIKALAAKARSADALAEIEALRDKTFAKNREVIDACVEFLVGTLGEEEYKELFGGQRVNMLRLFGLCAYIYEWAMADRAEVIKEYLDPPSEGADDAAAKAAD